MFYPDRLRTPPPEDGEDPLAVSGFSVSLEADEAEEPTANKHPFSFLWPWLRRIGIDTEEATEEEETDDSEETEDRDTKQVQHALQTEMDRYNQRTDY